MSKGMTDYKLMPEEATPEMEQAAEKYWNDRKFKALSDDPRTWKGLYVAMRAAAPAVQGEPVAWSGWGCQYPGKMPRLYGDRRIAELNCDWENGDQVLHFTAAPQPAEQAKPTRQYYYKVSSCKALSPDSDQCICWHDEGEGPLADGSAKSWRDAPTKPADQQPDVTQLVEIAKDIVDLHDKRRVVLTVHVEALREALDAIRKQGGE